MDFGLNCSFPTKNFFTLIKFEENEVDTCYSPRLRRAEDSLALTDKSISTSTEKEDFSTSASNNAETTQYAESRSDEIVDVLKALNLPTDFADQKASSSSSKESITEISSKSDVSSGKPTVPSPVQAASNDASTPNSRIARQFMTGNAMLDKIMNCPCAKEQLSAVGVKGVEYFNQPNPAIYREPPYGPNALGPGDVIATNLKSVGGTTGNVFGQIIRLLLGIPNLALSLLKPLIVGAADTLAQTTDAAAGVTAQAAKQLPVALRSGAVVIKRLLETFGDVTGSLLHVFSNLVASLAAAKTSLSGTLPFAFDILGDVSGRVAQTVGTAVDWVSGTTEILSQGVVQAAKTKGNLFSGLVEGTKGFKNGLLEGIKYGVNDEQPPADPNAQAWRR
ncbi:unnamed protein product [Allacma fusca]|uniref:Uncharacterized protein n=1 Tax=Allacma fusca TaxID=39272 RepID=A0A8J2PP95_9HEXA|nr:unnamed protein product [Allacma fusca]